MPLLSAMIKKFLALALIIPVFSFGEKAEIIESIDQTILQEMNRQKIPGFAAAIIVKGNVLHAKGYGYSDLQAKIKVTPQTLFGIGSVSKAMTAFLVMLLKSSGQINLDDSIRKYLSSAPIDFDGVTIRELLSHTSGIPNYQGPHLPWTQTWKKISKKSFQFEPGTSVKYNNFGYIVLTRLIEKVTGKTYSEFLKEKLLNPLNMHATKIPDDLYPQGIASRYHIADGKISHAKNLKPWKQMSGSGGIVSNLEDLIKWDKAMSAKKILSADSYKEMWSPQILKNGQSSGWGLGWHLFQGKGKLIAKKDGGIAGFRSLIVRHIDDEISLIFLSNANPVRFSPFVKPIIELFQKEKPAPKS